MSKNKILKAKLSDLSSIANLYLELAKFHKKFKYIDNSGKAINKKTLRKATRSYLASKNSLVLVAKENKKIVGFLEAAIKPDYRVNGEKVVEIINIYVSKKGENVGSNLLQKTIAWARRKNARFIEWEVATENKEAIKFCRKNDFREFKTKMVRKV